MIGRIQTRTVEKREQIGLFMGQMLRQAAIRRIPLGFLQEPVQSRFQSPGGAP